MIELDHVIVAVGDLAAAAERLERDFGLSSVEGGRHRGLGTANRIVPLGRSYVELMAVVDEDEAQGSVFAQLVRATRARGDRLGAVCLRTDDIAPIAQRFETPAVPSGRVRPDGSELRWELAGLEQAIATPGLPFFIQWHAGPDELPGAAPVEHRSGATGIAWVEIGGDEQTLRTRVGEDLPELRFAGGDPGVRRVGLATRDGELVFAPQ